MDHGSDGLKGVNYFQLVPPAANPLFISRRPDHNCSGVERNFLLFSKLLSVESRNIENTSNLFTFLREI